MVYFYDNHFKILYNRYDRIYFYPPCHANRISDKFPPLYVHIFQQSILYRKWLRCLQRRIQGLARGGIPPPLLTLFTKLTTSRGEGRKYVSLYLRSYYMNFVNNWKHKLTILKSIFEIKSFRPGPSSLI